MEPVICPNCETEISISDRMPTAIKCPGCGMEFGVEYEPDNPTFKEKLRKFYYAHEKQILGGCIVACLAAKAFLDYRDAISQEVIEASPSADTCSDSMPSETDSEAISEKTRTIMNLDNYDTKMVNHPMGVRNLPENQFPSLEKQKQARDLGIDLGLHQTIVDSYPQRHHTKKAE